MSEKKSPKRNAVSRVFAVIGVLCILAAIALIGYNEWSDLAARREAANLLAALEAQIPEEAEESSEVSGLLAEYVTEDDGDGEDGELLVDENGYIGILTIPALNLELPVHSEWSLANAKTAPCRYFGSIHNGNLVIAAHNYSSHFGKISQLNTGDAIYFTAVDGKKYTYEVSASELIYGYDIPSMLAGADEWDLTLFTCTWSGVNRVTVRAVRVED